MNVDDVNVSIPSAEYPQCRLWHIFDRQQSLMVKYEDIERANGFLTYPRNLHDRFFQQRCKDFAWRITEELAEASEARRIHPDSNHCIEEISDAYHFLIELSIMVGWDMNYIDQEFALTPGLDRLMSLFSGVLLTKRQARSSFDEKCWGVVESLGQAMNCLRNKPWKNTHVLTDIDKFHDLLRCTHYEFIAMCQYIGLDHDSLFRMYFRKSEVNKFRQQSNY